MVYYDHAMVGATLAVAVGAQRRYGWGVVLFAALVGMFPDWDALSKHFSPQTYKAGHRVWGHNLFAVTLAGAALGAAGYLIHRSLAARRPPGEAPAPGGPGPWVALGLLVMWSHPLLDLLYCGLDREADWPVSLLWPLASGGVGVPWVPWYDWGATALLATGLVAIAALRRHRQLTACVSLVIFGVYVAVRGFLLHGV